MICLICPLTVENRSLLFVGVNEKAVTEETLSNAKLGTAATNFMVVLVSLALVGALRRCTVSCCGISRN